MDLTLIKVKENIDSYIGTTVIWGGAIYEVRQGHPDPELEILHATLNEGGRPITEQGSSERFLVILPPAMGGLSYRLGMDVTVAGEIIGVRMDETGGQERLRPILRAREIHVWKPSPKPEIRFGFGIGATF